MSERIFLSEPYMGGYEMDYINQAFDENWISPMGANVTGFEEDVCVYTDMPYSAALVSGTAAIHSALRYFGVNVGDYVFCSDLTFAGSCNPIMYQNAIPVFIDCDEGWNMSPVALEKAFIWAEKNNKMPKAVIIVDLYGKSADFDKLLPLCQKYGVPVIEDAAEALGSNYKGKKCGSFGDISIFSFNGNKIITTSGGGMVVSHNKSAVDKIRFWSTQARENELFYHHLEYGYNYRLSNICAGIGRGQMKIIEKKIEMRKNIFRNYMNLMENLPFSFMPKYTSAEQSETNYWLTVGLIDANCKTDRLNIVQKLLNENIEVRPLWKPMHLQPVFDECPYFSHDNDVGIELFNKGICLPSSDRLTLNQQERIVDAIKKIL